MVSGAGTTIRFSEEDVRAMGRDAAGVRGMGLRPGDEVVSCDVARDEVAILMVTDNGFGKRTQLQHFNRQGRGGQGVRGIKLTASRGRVVAAFMVALDDEILLISLGRGDNPHGGPGRSRHAGPGDGATGVKVMNLDAGQVVAAVAPRTESGRGIARPLTDRGRLRQGWLRAKTAKKSRSLLLKYWSLLADMAGSSSVPWTCRPAQSGRCRR